MNNIAVSPAVAVIGMACRYPGANDLRAFWENILTKRRQFRPFPDQRFPLSEYYDSDPSAPDKTYCDKAALIDGFSFDWIQHRVPKSSFLSTDIVHWLALDVALQALADAGLSGNTISHERSGVILGNTLTGEQSRAEGLRLRWPFVDRALKAAARAGGMPAENISRLSQTMETYYKSVFAPVTEDTLAGSLSNTIAGRICNYLDLHGGGYTVDGACSSGLIAIATAAAALTNHDLDLALAGGVDISLDTFELIGFAKTGALAKTDMHVYDRRGSGFIPGEGCGIVALKRLEDAVQDGNYIYAVIRGWGLSSDGKGGLTAPSVKGQASALKRAYARAGLDPRVLDFIEGHGTGTTVGDKVELEAVSSVLGDNGAVKERSCGMTSLKSIIGHTKAASGIGGFIKAVIAVNQRILPPTANCAEPNEVFDGSARSLYPIITGEIRIPAEKINAGVSAMGFGGINCHVTIESADAPSLKLTPSIEERKLLVSHQDTELFVLSGGSATDLHDRVSNIRKLAQGTSEGELVDLAVRLSGELDPAAPLRAAFIAGSLEGLLDGLQDLENMLVDSPPAVGESVTDRAQNIFIGNTVQQCKVGFLFPGQGSQQLNMARTIVERHGWARDLIINADEWCGNYDGRRLSDFIYNTLDKIVDRKQVDEWSTLLRQTRIAQPAICLTSLLWVEKLNRLGIRPVAAGGHSLGELSAFHVAGAFDKEALLKLAKLRGKVMDAPADKNGIMASLACSYDIATDILGRVNGYAVVANINSPEQVVISGERSSIEKAVTLAADKGIITHILPVSNAFHSKFVSEAAEHLLISKEIPEVFGSTAVKLFTCVAGKPVEPGLKLREHFANQALSQVDFVSMVKALSHECKLILEVGPGAVLSKLSNAITDGHGPVCLPIESKAGNDRDLNRVLGECFVRGGMINWEELYEGRLVRPFIPASERIFIENPCERPFAASLQEVRHTIPKNDGPLDSAIADSVDLSPEVLSDYIARRGRFLGAVIKADIEQSTPHAQNTMSVPPDPHGPHKPAEAIPQKKETSAAGDIGVDTASISAMLIELVEKRTGFPRESLSLELRLLDDLNLDSIKAAELIAAAAMRLHLAGNLNASRFTNARLSEISETLARLVREGAGAGQRVDTMPDSHAPGHQEKTWVRNFVVHYVPEPLPSATATDQEAAWETSRVLILSEESESALAKALEKALAMKGAQVRIAFFSEAPLGWMDKGIEFTHYITVLPGKPNEGSPLDARLRAIIERLRTAIILLSAAKTSPSHATVAYVQFGGGRFGTEMERGDIEQCCATAFAASVHHESPGLKVRALDFSPHIGHADVASVVIHELSTPGHYSAVGYDSRMVRCVPRPRVQGPASYGKRTMSWSSDDVVLVTGGAKGITAECAFAFARATGVRMALVGSSPHPDHAPENGQGSELVGALERFTAKGLSCRYYRCDITDAKAVDLLIQQIRREVGPITGVIHGAGLNKPNRTENVSSEEALKEIGPKLCGAMNLCNALKDAPPKMFVGLTSIIGVTGMPGNAWYAFSNEAIDVLLRKFEKENPTSSVLCIAYSIWEEVGMGARLGSVQHLAKMGISAIPTSEGTRRFLHLLLNDPEARQVIVAARLGNLDTWAPERYAVPALRFLENTVTLEPNVEVIARAHLTLEKDPYVVDHLWRGTYLFPTVFGLEAMSQAVSVVTGQTDFNTLRIEDIRLERPIAVSPDTGCMIEIHAEVFEHESAGASRQVSVGVRCEQTGFLLDHFSATFIIGIEAETPRERIDVPERPLDIDPKRDLYGGLLFQGPLYQRIQRIYSLSSNKCIFLSELRPDPNMSGEHESSSWLMGDPFFRDSLLHAPQLPLARDICLPLRIAHIERYEVKGCRSDSLIGVAVIEDRNEREVVATVFIVDKNGYIVERLTGYILKVMEHHEEYPTAEELADPGKRDEDIIRSEIDRRANQIDVRVPEISSTHIPGIHQSPKAERHEQESSLLQETLRRALKSNGHMADESQIAWLESGKPIFEGAADTGLDISLSHDDGTVLCVAGPIPQGCDLASVAKRTREEWLGLFGKAREPLFQKLMEGTDSSDRAGTRIWAAIEALQKTNDALVTDIAIKKQQGDSVIFRSKITKKDVSVLTFPVRLTRGPERMIALTVQAVRDQKTITLNTYKNIHAKKLNFNFESHKFDISTGPQGQPLFIFQFPVTVNEASNPSHTLFFSHYFAWMGKLREYSIQPIIKNLAELFSTDKWGLFTNHAETLIIGDARFGDIIECRIWADRVSGKSESTIDMCFEWWKKTPDGDCKQIAFSTLSTTWVTIRDHRFVEVQSLPEFAREFFKKMLPPSDAQEVCYRTSEPVFSFDFCQELYREPAGPVKSSALLKEQIFETSLEDSNLVGNIYFLNFYLWQGRVRDHYINEIAPEYFNGLGNQGELRCIRCKVDHINEAIPFDRIAVRMYRTAIYEYGVKFCFDYYRIGPNGDQKKLGFGEHEAAWFAPTAENKWGPSELPKKICDALLPKRTQAKLVSSHM